MPSVLVVDDELAFRELYVQTLAAKDVRARAAGSAEEALASLEREPVDMVVSDVRLPGESGLDLLRRARSRWPRLPFLLVTAYADVRDAVSALKLGAVDYLAKPVDLGELAVAVRDTLGLGDGADPEIPEAVQQTVVAESPLFRAVLKEALLVAASDLPVVLTGESGTGKEVLANLIHEHGPRRGGKLVAVNCAALPEQLLASELFGHEKGAFTGATERRTGRFRDADGGTLFLDEVGEMPLALQPVLLRALETGKVTPLGSDREVKVNFRLVAATNRNLSERVQQGHFRLDLYHRLNVVQLELPPLRERPEDIVPLARKLLSQSGQLKRLSRAAIDALLAHSWPGNVRELINAIQRARVLSRGDVILPEHLPPAVRAATPVARVGEEAGGVLDAVKRASEAEALRRALEQSGGNRTKAAGLLGISRRGLIYKIKRYGL